MKFSSSFQLDTEPDHSFLLKSDDPRVLSSASLDAVRKVVENLRSRREANIKVSASLRLKIGSLFDKLQQPGKEEFLFAHSGCTKMVTEEVKIYFF
jgi:hypothetical protein